MEEASETRVVIGPSVCTMEIELDKVQVEGQGLLFVDALVQDKKLRMLVDSGATHSIVRRGLLRAPEGASLTELRARDFEGKVTTTRACHYEVPLRVADKECVVELIEWPLQQDFDGILGQTWLRRENPVINWVQGTLSWPRKGNCRRRRQHKKARSRSLDASAMDISKEAVVSPASTDPEVEWSELNEFMQNLKAGMYAEVFHLDVVDKTGTMKPDADIEALVREFSDYLREELPDGLPPERDIEHSVVLKSGAQSSSRPPFRHAHVEQTALRAFVDKLLTKRWIEKSSSAWVSNIFAVPKRDPVTGEMPTKIQWIRSGDPSKPVRWVIDYRYVNSMTDIPRIPIPRIDEVFDRLAGAHVFTLIDLASGYHQMRLAFESRQYTAFRAGSEIYQWCVAPMGLAGMPGTWSRLMRRIFETSELAQFVVVYLDDICVFSRTRTEHLVHLRRVFEILREEQLFARPSKCHFAQSEIRFLGHIISGEGVRVDPDKTAAVSNWSQPQNPKDLQRFLGLAGYYRRFVRGYADLVLPLSDLLKAKVEWSWSSAQERAFTSIKAALVSAPLLRLPDMSLPFQVTTDASKYCVGGVLSQIVNGFDHPVGFYSRKLSDTESRWPAHEQELYAIKQCLGRWRCYLLGSHFIVFTDNSACRWFLSHANLSAKMTRWLEFFGQFDFELQHKKGESNVVADALSRPPVVVTSVGVYVFTTRFLSRAAKLLVEGNAAFGPTPVLSRSLPSTLCVQSTLLLMGKDDDFVREVQAAYSKDKDCVTIMQSLRRGDRSLVKKYVLRDGLLYVKSDDAVQVLRVPQVDKILIRLMHDFHDAAVVSHPGRERTLVAMRQYFWWPGMRDHIRQYVSTCETCVRHKSGSRHRNGLLQSLPIPEECWQHVTMDFVTALPESEGYDAVYVVVCRLSNRPCYIPTTKDVDAKHTAKLFFDNVVRYYSLPESIVSDRDPKFTSEFWQELMRIMQVKHRMTVSRRAQADGRSERQVRTLEDSLRCVVSHYGDDWVRLLPTVEYAHATLVSTSTRVSPFEVDSGRKPRSPITLQSHLGPGPALNVTRSRRAVIEFAQKNLRAAQQRQAKYYNKGRRVVEFKKDDLVYVDSRVLSSELGQPDYDPSRDPVRNKMLPKWYGPFPVEEKIGENAYRLALPHRYLARGRHATFNVDQLKESLDVPEIFRARQITKSAPRLYDDEGERVHVIKDLLATRGQGDRLQYLCSWVDLPESANSWEFKQDIEHVSHWALLLERFAERQQAERQARRDGRTRRRNRRRS